MAIAGPVSSIILGFIFFGLFKASESLAMANSVRGVLQYLSWINWILAGFNLVPAFPLVVA